MTLLRSILVLAHLVGFALLLGGFVAHAKLAVKLGIAVVIAALFGVYTVATRRGGIGNRTQFAAIGLLAFANAAVAAIWQ